MNKIKFSLLILVFCSLVTLSSAQTIPTNAASWSTWIADADTIVMGLEIPTEAVRETETQELIALARDRDAESLAQIQYWNAASPSYRWIEVINDTYRNGPPNPIAGRAFALMNVAIYDAVITAYKAKASDGISPAMNEDLEVLVPVHGSSFPSEHAAAAIAASEILAYVNPDNAEKYRALAQEAMQTRMLAGANFKSDIEAGKLIGQAVAEEIIAKAKLDGSDAAWEYNAPEGTRFIVENPVFPVTGQWQPLVLETGSQFRAPEPPAYDSEQIQADLEEIKSLAGTVQAMDQATYWARFDSAMKIWYDFASRQLFEQRAADNAAYMALVYSGIGVAAYDATVGCFDSKYAYVYARPSHIDTSITPLIPVPPHPSYPSAHSCVSSAEAHVFAHFFPHETEEALVMAQAAGQSRIFGGIHYQIDNQAGLELGEKVAGEVIAKLGAMTQ